MPICQLLNQEGLQNPESRPLLVIILMFLSPLAAFQSVLKISRGSMPPDSLAFGVREIGTATRQLPPQPAGRGSITPVLGHSQKQNYCTAVTTILCL